MKHKKYDDDQLEDLLRKLPKVEDERNKQDVYRSIEPHLKKRRRTIRPWIMPGIASVAVIFMLALFIPSFFSSWHSGDQSFESASFQAATDSSGESADMESDEPESAKEVSTPEHTPDEASNDKQADQPVKKDSTKETAELKEKEIEPVKTYTVYFDKTTMEPAVYLSDDTQTLVPVTWTGAHSLSTKQINERVDISSFGLTALSAPYSIKVDKKQATVIFPDNFTVQGSAAATWISDSIKWKLDPYDVETITLQTESGHPVSLGNYGMVDRLSPVEEGGHIYQVHSTLANKYNYLIPVPLAGDYTIEEALNELKVRHKNTTPAVPEHVRFLSVSESKDILTIEVNHGEWSKEQRVLALDAILMTAGQFGYNEVLIKGIEKDESSIYELDRSIKVPNAVNPLPLP